jgi:hypothetical protein
VGYLLGKSIIASQLIISNFLSMKACLLFQVYSTKAWLLLYSACIPVLGMLFCWSSFTSAALGQATTSDLWTDVQEYAIQLQGTRTVVPEKYRTLCINTLVLANLLRDVPSDSRVSVRSAGRIITLPFPDGTFARFRFVESPVMAPGLAAKFPQIKTYTGRGVDNPGLSVNFDFSPAGFHGMIYSPADGLIFIDPYSAADAIHYICYFQKDYKSNSKDSFLEGDIKGMAPAKTKEMMADVAKAGKESRPLQATSQLRTYRLAVAATGEFTQFHSGSVENAQAAIATIIHRVNLIYIRDVAIRFELIAGNDTLIYTDADTDPYRNGNTLAMLNENQGNLDAVIGSANYDIGHVFSTGTNQGRAGFGVVCRKGEKAKGVSISANPTGDAFDVGLLAHEIGHQFGAHHTFNGTEGNCGANRDPSAAFEPGSGTTIMSYARGCGTHNVLDPFLRQAVARDTYFPRYPMIFTTFYEQAF